MVTAITFPKSWPPSMWIESSQSWWSWIGQSRSGRGNPRKIRVQWFGYFGCFVCWWVEKMRLMIAAIIKVLGNESFNWIKCKDFSADLWQDWHFFMCFFYYVYIIYIYIYRLYIYILYIYIWCRYFRLCYRMPENFQEVLMPCECGSWLITMGPINGWLMDVYGLKMAMFEIHNWALSAYCCFFFSICDLPSNQGYIMSNSSVESKDST